MAKWNPFLDVCLLGLGVWTVSLACALQYRTFRSPPKLGCTSEPKVAGRKGKANIQVNWGNNIDVYPIHVFSALVSSWTEWRISQSSCQRAKCKLVYNFSASAAELNGKSTKRLLPSHCAGLPLAPYGRRTRFFTFVAFSPYGRRTSFQDDKILWVNCYIIS